MTKQPEPLIFEMSSPGRTAYTLPELDVPQSTVSRHLAVLRERGLISGEREGTAVYYSLVDERIIDALDLMRAVLATQLTAGADLVQPSH